jgi:hypothetical protein
MVLAAVSAVAILAMGFVLLLETVSSQAHTAALSAISDPAGQVAKKIGLPKRVILAGSSSRTLTVGNVTQSCGSNRYLVFTDTQWSWVEVTFYKPENKEEWVPREVLVGWNSRPIKAC